MGGIYVANGAESPLAVQLNFESVRLTEEQFYQLCEDNPEARLELTADGELMAMPPTGAKTGAPNMKLSHRLQSWSEKDGRGIAFDSSTGFALPNGAKRSPDASWLGVERWDALSHEEQAGFAPLCPDFVVELRSPTDGLQTLQRKMAEYIDNGAGLGWLIDPLEKCVDVYRSGQPDECLENPAEVLRRTHPSRLHPALERHLVGTGHALRPKPVRTALHRSLGTLDDVAVTPIAVGERPFFSPDRRWIGFRDGAALEKAATSGGPAVFICECAGRGYLWIDDDVLPSAST